MANDDIKKLEMRIAQLETMLERATARTAVSDLTADEIKAFQKVRDALAFDPDTSCGINECARCIVTRICRLCHLCHCHVCKVCDVECVCGPCIMGAPGGRFGNLGG
jgi:hypothetical protein